MSPLWHNTNLIEIPAEISALLLALERHGHGIEGYADEDPSHPIVTSRYPQRVNEIESRLIPDWEHANPAHRAIIRRTR